MEVDGVLVKGIGLVVLKKHWSNNRFDITWGGSLKNDNLIQVVYNDGYWKVEQLDRNLDVNYVEVPSNLKLSVTDAILKFPEVRECLEKYRTSCLRRLEVSIPRLREELRVATERMKALKADSFK